MNEKFNTIMEETDGKALCIMVDKPISEDGYLHNFLPRLQKMAEENGELRILVYYKQFLGWEEEAANFDMEATVKYGRLVKKMAIVNPPEKEIFSRKIKQPLMGGEVKFFSEEDLTKALKWVKA